MLDKILGGATAEKVLLFLFNYQDAYASEISECFGVSLSMVQKQLARFEEAGVLVSRLRGRTRIYTWNPRYAFKKEIRAILEKAIELLPPSECKKYFSSRTRPRRSSKGL